MGQELVALHMKDTLHGKLFSLGIIQPWDELGDKSFPVQGIKP